MKIIITKLMMASSNNSAVGIESLFRYEQMAEVIRKRLMKFGMIANIEVEE